MNAASAPPPTDEAGEERLEQRWTTIFRVRSTPRELATPERGPGPEDIESYLAELPEVDWQGISLTWNGGDWPAARTGAPARAAYTKVDDIEIRVYRGKRGGRDALIRNGIVPLGNERNLGHALRSYGAAGEDWWTVIDMGDSVHGTANPRRDGVSWHDGRERDVRVRREALRLLYEAIEAAGGVELDTDNTQVAVRAGVLLSTPCRLTRWRPPEPAGKASEYIDATVMADEHPIVVPATIEAPTNDLWALAEASRADNRMDERPLVKEHNGTLLKSLDWYKRLDRVDSIHIRLEEYNKEDTPSTVTRHDVAEARGNATDYLFENNRKNIRVVDRIMVSISVENAKTRRDIDVGTVSWAIFDSGGNGPRMVLTRRTHANEARMAAALEALNLETTDARATAARICRGERAGRHKQLEEHARQWLVPGTGPNRRTTVTIDADGDVRVEERYERAGAETPTDADAERP